MIRVENLSIQFQQGNQKVEAVKGISFEVGSQETVALVGESGSGKSVTAHAALKLLPPQAHCAGKIWLGEATGRPTKLRRWWKEFVSYCAKNEFL
jgi:ABC-type dipeptide/oligopeptide/nickel transport system ATPase component